VLPPKAACITIALWSESSVRTSLVLIFCDSSSNNARAERRAMSSQMAWPDGARAECVIDNPNASATT
jgi:hypothetical protein